MKIPEHRSLARARIAHQRMTKHHPSAMKKGTIQPVYAHDFKRADNRKYLSSRGASRITRRTRAFITEVFNGIQSAHLFSMQAHLDDYARSHGVPQVRIKGMEYPEKQQANNLIPISSIFHRSKLTSIGSISG